MFFRPFSRALIEKLFLMRCECGKLILMGCECGLIVASKQRPLEAGGGGESGCASASEHNHANQRVCILVLFLPKSASFFSNRAIVDTNTFNVTKSLILYTTCTVRLACGIFIWIRRSPYRQGYTKKHEVTPYWHRGLQWSASFRLVVLPPNRPDTDVKSRCSPALLPPDPCPGMP